jgi:hypothetical protein
VRNSLVGEGAVASVVVFLRCSTGPSLILSAWFRKRKGRTEHGVKQKRTKEIVPSREKKKLEMELESLFETQ